jgi:benzil reductase ((S)-benzoin forming)
MSFRTGAPYAKALAESRPSIALVTGGRSGIGLALASKIAGFPFIDQVLAVSRSIKESDVADISPKITPLQADVGTSEGRQKIVETVKLLCANVGGSKKQLRYLIHSAGTIDPIKNILDIQPEELRHAMSVNCESPFFLTTALYPFMNPVDESGVAGRVLHVSSGAAHGAPPSGWGCYGITKAAFFQSFRVLEREFRETLGGKVVVGSFKPGVVDTSMQGTIRQAPVEAMPVVASFQKMKEKAAANGANSTKARPPPAGVLDSPDNVAFFVEYLLLGTTDEEFANNDDASEYDIRNKELYPRWIAKEDLSE